MSNAKAVEPPAPPPARKNVQSIGAGLRARDPLAMMKSGVPATPPAVAPPPASNVEVGGESPSAPAGQESAVRGEQVAAPAEPEVAAASLVAPPAVAQPVVIPLEAKQDGSSREEQGGATPGVPLEKADPAGPGKLHGPAGGPEPLVSGRSLSSVKRHRGGQVGGQGRVTPESIVEEGQGRGPVEGDKQVIGRALERKLMEVDSQFGRVMGKLQVALLMPLSVDSAIENLVYDYGDYGVTKTAVVSAAVARWIATVEEELWKKAIPTNSAQLTGLSPEVVNGIMANIVDYRDEPARPLNVAIPSVYDAKVGSVAYLLGKVEKRVSKRCIFGSCCIKFLPALLEILGKAPKE